MFISKEWKGDASESTNRLYRIPNKPIKQRPAKLKQEIILDE